MTNAKGKKTILITGATTGIGRHAALHLSRKSFRVIATGRNQAALDSLRTESSGAIETVRLDVTDRASIAAAVIEVDRLTNNRGLDVLINNAGYGQAGPVEELSEDAFRAQMETNVFGLLAVTRAFLPRMRARGAGRILNVSSVGGRTTMPLFGAYHASKYAVEALSDAMRLELVPFGIRTVLIEPGPIRSEFADRTMDDIAKQYRPESPYAAIYLRADEIKKFSDKQAVGPERVARAMERAITARRPAARYVVPFSSRVMLWALENLPTSWTDALMRRLIGLTPKALARVQGAPAQLAAPPASATAPSLRS